jgi:S-adenosylmethionine-diacylglycerol 3-amino-3-carboxypropyl transferase
MTSEAAKNADFSALRYGQCWEDADVLLKALGARPGKAYLSIASAGDNAIALLTRAPARVVAVDLNLAQLAALELRVAAYRELSHRELLVLLGSCSGENRDVLYRRCRSQLSRRACEFWDAHPDDIQRGIGGAGKFERYFAMFRERILPVVHSRAKVEQLLRPRTLNERTSFYNEEWDTWRWRLLFRVFFSRFVMGHFGRDPSFFKYVEGNVAERILERTRYALTQLDPAENPYAQWILTGFHPYALPVALRAENFECIRANIGRLEWHQVSLEEFLDHESGSLFDGFNLSDIFEYISSENYEDLLRRVVRAGRLGSRLVYWNMLAKRCRPDSMKSDLAPLDDLAHLLYAQDKAFFYSALVIEEVL